MLVISETVFASDEDEERFARLMRHAQNDLGIRFEFLMADGGFREQNIFVGGAGAQTADPDDVTNIFAA